jgi:hypothetical protein
MSYEDRRHALCLLNNLLPVTKDITLDTCKANFFQTSQWHLELTITKLSKASMPTGKMTQQTHVNKETCL